MNDFTWIPLYQEIARRLLEYEHQQTELIDWLKQINATGVPVIPLGDVAENDERIEIEEIDPFTFFATFNRGIRTSARIEILKHLKEWWNLESELPTDFKGVPLVNNMHSWFFHWKKDRTPDEISNLWHLAHEVLDKTFDELSPETFDNCLKRTPRGMLTMGMFWINPYNYLALDRNNRSYLRKFGIESKHAKSTQSYIQICQEVKGKINEDFPTISHKARLDADSGKTPPTVPIKQSKAPRVWTIGTGENGSQWQDFLKNQIISIDYDLVEDLRTYESREELKQKVWGEDGDSKSRRNDAHACWQFANEMQVGDYVFAKQGAKFFYGLCRVIGDYEFDENRESYPHIRRVEWISDGGPWEITKDTQPAYKTLTEIGAYSDFVQRLFNLVDVPIPDNLEKRLPVVADNEKQYWWINADPGIWSYSEMKVGETQSYTTHNGRGNKRQKYRYFGEVKPGDSVVGYVISPKKELVAICEITQGTHANEEGESIEFKLIEYFNKSISYEELKSNPDLSECEPLKNNHGSLFKIKENEYEIIRGILEDLNPRIKVESVSAYTKNDALSELFMFDFQLENILSLLKRKKNIILQGPPGVGKTFAAKRLAFVQMGKKDNSRVEMVQFHQSYTYEDFIQGYRLNENGNFTIKSGIFYEFCRRAQRDPENDYFFIIDEINRGNLSKIFGELMMLIEHDKRGKEFELPLTYAKNADDRFYIPDNVYLIGTMNTADRSLSMVDYALRRRFAFVTLEPQFGFLSTFLNADAALVDRIAIRMGKLNSLIASDTRNLGKGFCIGHSYFCPLNDVEVNDAWYREIVETEIRPLLEEYWIDQDNKVQQAIEILLGNSENEND